VKETTIGSLAKKVAGIFKGPRNWREDPTYNIYVFIRGDLSTELRYSLGAIALTMLMKEACGPLLVETTKKPMIIFVTAGSDRDIFRFKFFVDNSSREDIWGYSHFVKNIDFKIGASAYCCSGGVFNEFLNRCKKEFTDPTIIHETRESPSLVWDP